MSQSTPALPRHRYAVAIGLIIIAMLARWFFLPILGPSTPFILLAITISAWYGGLGPGLLATFTSSVLLIIFRLPMTVAASHAPLPIWPLTASILFMGTLISFLLESLHRVQKEAAQNVRKLRESNTRFYQLVNSVKDYGIFMMDPEGYIISWNDGAEAINGYKAEEILGQHFSRFYPPEGIAAHRPEKELAFAAETGRFEEEGWRLRKDGSRFWANVIVTAVYDEDGKLQGFSKVTRDMTERRQIEERNHLLLKEQAARTEAEAANKAKDQFLSVLSHELRTPLNSIIGWIALLRSGKLDQSMTQTAFESIERSSKAQTRLVEDLLDVSRMLAGKLSIERTAVELNFVAQTVVDRIRPAIQEKQIALEVRYYPTPIHISGDSIRLEQILTNLLENALKFTPNDGKVTLSLAKADSKAEIIVKDTGIGIPPEALPHIFENFRQADSSHTRRHGGLGLGLAIVRYMVEAHGGKVEASSKGKDQGATFTVEFPLIDTGPERTSIAPESTFIDAPVAGKNDDAPTPNETE